MTSLTKAIEAAREALESVGKTYSPSNSFSRDDQREAIEQEAREALAALPDKPMTEKEIAKIIALAVFGECDEYELSLGIEAVEKLKAANCLYVKEG